MATNRKYAEGKQLVLAPTGGTKSQPESGDPVIFGERPGVCLDDASDTIANSGTATIQFDGVFELDVVGTSDDGTTDAAVTAGDIVYLDDSNNQLSVNTSGTRFGYALEDVASGATTTIQVAVGY